MAVEVVNDANFEDLLGKNNKVVVKYFADWCGSCRLFSPKYRRMSDEATYSDVVFLDINAEKNPSARKKAGVTNLPFFAVFKNGELVDHAATNKEDAVRELLAKLN